MAYEVPHSPSFPVAYAMPSEVWVASHTLIAAGAWTHSAVLDVRIARYLATLVYYTADSTGGTGGYPRIELAFSSNTTAPLANDDAWEVISQPNETRAVVTPSGTIASGTDYTFAPGYAECVMERLIFRTLAMANDTDKVRHRWVFPCNHARWARLMYAEAGDTANPGDLSVLSALCI